MLNYSEFMVQKITEVPGERATDFCLPRLSSSMATMNLSFTSHISPSPSPSPSLRLRSLPSCFPQTTPTIGFNSHVKTSSISLKQVSGVKKPPYKLRSLTVVSSLNKISETASVTLPDDDVAGNLPSGAGIYAIYDQSNELQFIGISRNVSASITGHRKSLPDLCCSVKVGIVEEPDRNALTQAWKSWMEEHIGATGKVPPGNEKGNTTWVKPPPKAKSDLRLTPGRHVQLTVPLEQLIDQLVKENKVVAFIKGSRSAPQCGFSQRVVGMLDSQGVDYESVDVLDEEYNHGLRETLKTYSNWPTFPQIFVDGELIGGCDILTSMYEEGEISKLVKR